MFFKKRSIRNSPCPAKLCWKWPLVVSLAARRGDEGSSRGDSCHPAGPWPLLCLSSTGKGHLTGEGPLPQALRAWERGEQGGLQSQHPQRHPSRCPHHMLMGHVFPAKAKTLAAWQTCPDGVSKHLWSSESIRSSVHSSAVSVLLLQEIKASLPRGLTPRL